MKRIAYVELDTHAEIARNFMELLEDSDEFIIDYYFSARIIKQIGKHHSNIHLIESKELMDRLADQRFDLVIIGTVHRYFNLFNEVVRRFNTAVIVHNINFTNLSVFQLFKNIFKNDFKYRLKLLLQEELLSAPKVFENAKHLLVLDQSLRGEQFELLPIFYFKESITKIENVITIVIPGSVEQSRRDYKMIIEKLRNLKSKTPFKFIFLGKAEGKELGWLEEFEKTKPQTVVMKYFTDKVPQDKFEEIMQTADLLWCPIQKETEFFSSEEIYGETKMSGNIGDAIKYGKYAVFPSDHDPDHAFLVPQMDDVEKQILNFNIISSFDFQADFGRNKIKKDLERVLKSLISS